MKKILSLLIVLMLAGCYANRADGRLERDRWARGAWSFFIPGVGQLQNGERLKGGLFLFGGMLANSAYRGADSDQMREEMWSLSMIISLWSAQDAIYTADKLNKTVPIRYGSHYNMGIQPPTLNTVSLAVDPTTQSYGAVMSMRF